MGACRGPTDIGLLALPTKAISLNGNSQNVLRNTRDTFPLPNPRQLASGACCALVGALLELELIQTHMAQKPLLWVEVGAHAVRSRSKFGGVGWAGAGVAWRLGVCGVCVVFEAL
jgi:hypothetical protein